MFEIFMYSGLGLVVVLFIATFFIRRDSSDEEELIEKYATKLVRIAAQDEGTSGMTRYIAERYGRKFLYKVVDRALEMDDRLYVSRIRD